MEQAEGVIQEQALRQAGFNDQEVAQWKSDTAGQLQGAGFQSSEIQSYFGAPAGEPTDLKPIVHGNLKEHLAERTPEGGGPAKATSFADAFWAGLQGSSGGLAARNKLPDIQLPPDPSLAMKIAAASGQMAGDLPAMWAGGVIGSGLGAGVGAGLTPELAGAGAIPGAVLGGGAGAFALPAMLRRAYMDDLQKGAVKDFSDFYSRLAGVAYDGIKGGVTGALTAGVGGAAASTLGKLGAGATTTTLATAGAELTTMTTVGKAMEGEAPKPEDFLIGAITLAGFHGAIKGADLANLKLSSSMKDLQTKLQNVYAETGVKPTDVLEAAAGNPVLNQQLLSRGTDVPAILHEPGSNPEFQVAQPSPDLAEPHPTMGEGFSPPSNIEVRKAEPPKDPGESVALSPQEQVHERIGEESPKPKLTFDKAYTAMLDRLNPIKNLVDTVQNGEALPVEKDPFALFRLAGASDGKADAFVRFGPRDVSGEATGTPGLKQIFKDAGGDVDGLVDYAIAKHSIELEAAGKKTGVPQDAAKALVEAGASKFEKPLKSLVQFQNDVLGYLRDSGVITPDLHNESVKQWESYVPFNRVEQGAGSGKGPGSTMPIKAIHGSDLKLVNPLESIIRNTFAYMKIADLNRAKLSLVDLAAKQESSLIEKVPTSMRPIEVSSDEISRYMEAQGIQMPKGSPKDADPKEFDIWRPLSLPLAKDEMAVMRNGKREVYNVGEDVAKAALADPRSIPAIVKVLSFPSKLLRIGAVDTLDFLAKHGVRDTIMSSIYSKNGFVPIWTSLVGLKEFFTEGKAYQDWWANGGGMANFTEIDRDYIQKDIYSLSKQTGLLDKVPNVIKNPLELGKLGLDIMHYMAEGVVSAPRIGEFKLAQEAGKSDLQAAMESRELTIDNQRMGAADSLRFLSSMKAFWNTRIQGLDKMARSLDPRENPAEAGKTLAKFVTRITLPSLLLWMVNKDNEDYQNLPRWQKDLFWMVPLPGGGFARIPKPFEAGLLFGSLPERMLNDFYKKDPDAFKGFGGALAEGANLGIPYPDFAKPMIEQFANKSLLTGGNLISDPLTKMSPEFQYNPYTSETAKILGSVIAHVPFIGDMGHGNITLASPMIVQNYIRAWTGGMGMYALDAADKALEKAGVTPAKVAPTPALADIPFIKSFVVRYPSAGAQPIQDFYENFQKAQTRLANIQGLAKRGDISALQGYMASPQFQEHVAGMAQVEKTLGMQNKMVSLIYANPSISPDQKRQQIDGLYYMMISEAKAANQAMHAIDAAMKGAHQ